jgi:hypothetical protein
VRRRQATGEPVDASPPPTGANSKKRSARDDGTAADAGNKKTKKKQHADKTEAKKEASSSTLVSDDDLCRELLEVRDSLTALQANTKVKEHARAAAADVIEVVTVLLQRIMINDCFGDILRSNCFWSEQELLGELELLDEELGVWQWTWLYVKHHPDEYITWLMRFVPIGFADMCHGMARHYADDVPVRAPIGPDDHLGYDSATAENAADEASADTREFVVADSDPIEYLSEESEVKAQPRRRRRK